ncbi:super-infection exclusion protein B [Acinetobacter johnsonii]|uniref:super-infection exclusion protein B n=1 Tax=Acinetobacter johnsonii TaxID=40214 RepID=UPI0011E73AC9|nr:super-infection exclusion protein B [Acinetobacter johnsonii]QEK35889.1 hypothetical protein FYN22_08420 [Acinetobacter johnsonii]
MESLKIVLDIFRTHNIILYILFISSGLITFDILDLRQRLGLSSLGSLYFALIGIAFLVSTSCLVFLLINSLGGGLSEKILKKLDDKKMIKNIDQTLNTLSNGEIVILSQYYIKDSDTLWMPLQGTEITSLVSKNILYLSQKNGRSISNGMTIFHYSINPVIKDKVFSFLKELFEGEQADSIRGFYNKFAPNYLEELEKAKRLWNL